MQRQLSASKENLSFGFRTRFDIKLRLKEVEELLCCENLICAFVFAYAKSRFSHDMAQIYRENG